jgi:hypothetical protein
MPKGYKKIGFLLTVLLPLVLSLSACVPVVIIAVGAAAGKGVVDEKSRTENQQNPQPATNGEGVIQSKETKPKESIEASSPSEIKTAQIEPKVRVPEKAAAVPQRPEVSPQAGGKSLHILSEATTVNDLINKGWKVSLSEPQQNNMLEVTLYFDASNHFYGFDGCKHFKGKFVAGPNNQLLIKSLIVSLKGSTECGNEIERNLFFVNSFSLHDKDIHLSNNDKLVMTLTQIEHFNTNAFLTKAKVKYRTDKNIVKKSGAK